MKILLATDYPNFEDWDDPPSKEVEDALGIAERAAVGVSQFYEGNLRMALTNRPYDACLISAEAAGVMQPAWEQYIPLNIVLFSDRVEIRMFERLEMGNSKYAIHTEKVPTKLTNKYQHEKFISTFFRQLAVDKNDIRKAVRMGAKNVR